MTCLNTSRRFGGNKRGFSIHMTADAEVVSQRVSPRVPQKCKDTPVNQQKLTDGNHTKYTTRTSAMVLEKTV
jgi:hypothetical protein